VKQVPGKNGGRVNQFEKGESGNPKGRPRKLVSAILKEYNAVGLEPVTSEQVKGMIENLLNMRKDELDKVATDNDAPVGLRLIARHLVKAGDKEQVAEWLLSRAHGRSQQSVDVTSGGEAIKIVSVGVDLDKI
jgi:hypothetical protein